MEKLKNELQKENEQIEKFDKASATALSEGVSTVESRKATFLGLNM